MRYCTDCGNPHECEGQVPAGPSPEVRIAEINADRDKYIARVQSRMHHEELETAEDIAETDAEASIVGDVAAAEILAAELGAEGGAETGEPIVVEVPDAPAEPDPAAEEPPAVEAHMPRQPKGGGYWSNYK